LVCFFVTFTVFSETSFLLSFSLSLSLSLFLSLSLSPPSLSLPTKNYFFIFFYLNYFFFIFFIGQFLLRRRFRCPDCGHIR
jgi:hypothetical protein